MKKWLHNMMSRMASRTTARVEEAASRETAAMVYVGDIYAVLLHDRAARRLARVDYRGPGRDASWPFIR